jgi:hypothetical protein
MSAIAANAKPSGLCVQWLSNGLQDYHRMTPMAFILQFYDPIIESVQVLFQFLNLLNRKTSTGKLINGLSILCARCWQITVQGSLPLCGHGPSESRTPGYATLSRLDL